MMTKHAKLIIFEPWNAYEVIEGVTSKIPLRFLANDGRSFWLYPNIWELLTRWPTEGKLLVTVYERRTKNWIGLGILEKLT
jgi:hypothetical protein